MTYAIIGSDNFQVTEEARRINEAIQYWEMNGHIFTEGMYDIFQKAISSYGLINPTKNMPKPMKRQLVEYMRNKRMDSNKNSESKTNH